MAIGTLTEQALTFGGTWESETRICYIVRTALSENTHSSLRNLCVLCVSVVVFTNNFLTTETQRTQRLHREVR